MKMEENTQPQVLNCSKVINGENNLPSYLLIQ